MRTSGFILAVTAILLFAAALGARHLNSDGIWLDEWWSLYGAGSPLTGNTLPPAGIWERQAVEDPYNLPGFPWLLAGWASLVGWSEAAGRTLSLFFGILATAVIARTGADLRGKSTGIGAALAAGTSAWMIYYLHELRTFTLVAFLSALLLLLYLRALRRREVSIRLSGSIALITAGLLYTHYFAALLVAVLGFTHLLRLRTARPGKAWWHITLAFAVGTLAFVPWLGSAWTAMRAIQSQQRVMIDAERLFSLSTNIAFVFSNGLTPFFLLLVLINLKNAKAFRILGMTCGLWGLILCAYAIFSVAEVRYAFGLLPFLALLAGFGIAQLAQRGIPLSLTALVLCSACLYTADTPEMWRRMQRTPPQPFREVRDLLIPAISAQDRLLYVLDWDADTRGVHEAPFRYYTRDMPGDHGLISLQHNGISTLTSEFESAIGDAQRLWLVYNGHYPSNQGLLLDSLASNLGYLPCGMPLANSRITARPYSHADIAADTAQFTGGIRVQQIGEISISPQSLSTWLIFHVSETIPPDTYSVAIHVIGADGSLRSQDDFPLPQTGATCQFIQIPRTGMQSGTYGVRLIIYDWRSGQRMEIVSGSSPATDAYEMGSVNAP